MSTDHVINEISKSDREVIRVAFSEFEGATYIAARVWFASAGKMLPGKNGLNVKVELLPALAEALTQALVEARARGLLP
jgi:hypothetical protein